MAKKKFDSQRLILSTGERLRKDLIFINNPVLVGGLALAPIIAAAVTLRNAAMLSVMVFVLLIPTRFIGNLLVGFVPQRLRAMVYALIASLLYLPGLMLLLCILDVRAANLGIYLPMLVVDSIIIARTEIPQRESIGESLKNGILTAFGFSLAVVVTGAIREILGFGRIWGIGILKGAPVPIASTTVGGFIVVALLAAMLQALSSVIKRAIYRRARENE